MSEKEHNLTSSFSGIQQEFPDAELLPVDGATCQCYRVRLYGKLHFLKRLKPEFRTDPRYVAALRKEFETGYTLEHPALVRYVSHGDDYILMDYVDGETLDLFLKHHSDFFADKKNSDRFLQQLLSAVSYLHAHQVLHLDLKPQNILLTRIGNDVRLVDFGFSYTDSFPDTLGRTNRFAAPEQTDGSNAVDERTDIYAIGKLMETLPCASRYRRVIHRCTQPEKELRYQTVAEVQKALERRGRWLLWAIPLLVVLLVAIAALLWWHQPGTLEPTPESSLPQDTIVSESANISPVSHVSENNSAASVEQNADEKIEVGNETSEMTPKPSKPQDVETDMTQLIAEHHSLIDALFESNIGCYRDSVAPYDMQVLNERFENYSRQSAKVREDLIRKYPHLPIETVFAEFSQYEQNKIEEIAKIFKTGF